MGVIPCALPLTLTVEGAGEDVTEIGSVFVLRNGEQFGESRTLVRVKTRMKRFLAIVGFPPSFILGPLPYTSKGQGSRRNPPVCPWRAKID